MGLSLTTPKIRPDHLERRAFIYVRQSTLLQVREHTASTARQYDLVQRARDLGWAQEHITVVDRIFPSVLSRFSSYNCLILRMILRMQRARPSAYIRRTLLESGNRVPNAFRMAACRASGNGRREIAVPRTW